MQSLQILNNYNAHACILRRHDPWLLVCTKQYYYLHTPADLAFACGLDDRNKLPSAALSYTVHANYYLLTPSIPLGSWKVYEQT